MKHGSPARAEVPRTRALAYARLYTGRTESAVERLSGLDPRRGHMTLIEDRNDPKYCKLPHMDGRCGARWGKQIETHCYTCHETMNDVEAWDAHMPKGICSGPASAGLVLVAHRVYRVWGFPSPDELPLAWR